MQKVEDKTLFLEDKKIHYLESGKGDCLILIHGWLGSSDDFKEIMDCLPDNYHAIAPDLPGFGFKDRVSDEFTSKHTISSYVKFLNLFLKKLGIEKASLIGTSMGATISLEYAKNFGEYVDKIIAFEPTIGGKEMLLPLRVMSKISSIDRSRKILRWLYVQGEKINPSFKRIDEKNKQEIIDEVYSGSLRAASESATDLALGVNCEEYKKIKVPCLLVFGSVKNPFMTEKTENILFKNIPESQLVKVYSIGHAFTREDPETFARLIANFIEDKI